MKIIKGLATIIGNLKNGLLLMLKTKSLFQF
jgi:hypothetical protein